MPGLRTIGIKWRLCACQALPTVTSPAIPASSLSSLIPRLRQHDTISHLPLNCSQFRASTGLTHQDPGRSSQWNPRGEECLSEKSLSPNSQLFLGQSLGRLLLFFPRHKRLQKLQIQAACKSFCPRRPAPPSQRALWRKLPAVRTQVSFGLPACLEEKQPSLRSQTSSACRRRPPAICPRLSLACLLGAKNSENGPQGPARPAQPSSGWHELI